MTKRQWISAAKRLGKRKSRLQWDIGDWALEGERNLFIEDDYDVLPLLDISYQTLKNIKVVAKAYPKTDRRFKLPWTHYQTVVSLDNRLEWLRRAEEGSWTREKLRLRAFGRREIGTHRLSIWLPENDFRMLLQMVRSGQSVSVLASEMVSETLNIRRRRPI